VPLDDFVAGLQGRWGTPEEIADTVLHLSSDAAAFVSGAIHNVDNGLLARLF
jgi:NAD(P)-dependent dehydrogenase (short-subunit alcohol dehydrogenase family)